MKKTINKILNENLISFVKRGFAELNPNSNYIHNWHIEEICSSLIKIYTGAQTRLVIAMPPRYLKSICISVCFPAWVLGREPKKRIIVSSYSASLSYKHSLDTKKIIQSDWYKKLFPETIIAKGQNQKNKFVTTKGGFRIATSSGGTLTGEGGDILIVDDPHKPLTVKSKIQREKVIEWFEGTLLSRLNDKKTGGVIIVMQRLHPEDLVGFLIEKKKIIWNFLILKAIAEEDEKHRKKGEPLHLKRENLEELQKIKEEMGEKEFLTQYQQSPESENYGMLNKNLFITESFEQTIEDTIVISIDSASKIKFNHDFTVLTIWIIREEKLLILDVIRVKLEFGELLNFVQNKINLYNAKFVLIEDKSSGIALIQELNKVNQKFYNVIAIKPKFSKEIRFLNVIYYFERKLVIFNKNIPELAYIKEELLLFPHAKHDDVVDSIVNFLSWHSSMFNNIKPKPEIKIRSF